MATTKISKLRRMTTPNGSDVLLVADTDAAASKKITHTNFETDLESNPLPVGGGGTGANLSATGGANEFVKQAGAGAVFTIGTIAAADLPTAGETAVGAIELATQTEVNNGTDTIRAVVPSTLDSKVSALTNIGEIKLWGNTTPPFQWLLCDGTAVSRTTYADLFALISTTYGTGDGSTTFNLPDLSGRSPLGVSGAYALASTGGAETVTLVTAELPAHTHTVNNISNARSTVGSGSASATPTSDPSGSTGGGGAHNNLPPFLTFYFIIYAGE